MSEYAKKISEWIKNRVKRKETNMVCFYISLANVEDGFHENELMNEIIKKFDKCNINIDFVDTVPGSFNSNRIYLKTDKFEAAYEYCGVYPVQMNTEDSAWLAELDDSGKVRIIVYKN